MRSGSLPARYLELCPLHPQIVGEEQPAGALWLLPLPRVLCLSEVFF